MLTNHFIITLKHFLISADIAYSVSQYDTISDESPSAVLNNHKIYYIYYQTRDVSNQSRHTDHATQTDASWFASVVKLKDFLIYIFEIQIFIL